MKFKIFLTLISLMILNKPNTLAMNPNVIMLHHSNSNKLNHTGILSGGVSFGPCAEQTTPARMAIANNNLDMLKSLVTTQRSSIVAYRGASYGETLLHVAATQNKPDFVNYLVKELGFDINIRDSSGATPAHYAVTSAAMDNDAALEMVKLLKSLGANLTLTDYSNSSLVMDAQEEKRSPDFIRELLQLIIS